MGNSESSLRNSFPSTKSSVAESSRRPAKKQVKIFTTHSNSSSPNPETGRKRSDSANEVSHLSRNSTSLNYHQQKHSTDRSNRRTKSFRAGIGNTGSFRHRNGLGSAAELSNTQKRLIQLIFEETDKLTFYDFVHNVFQTIFSRDKRLLKVIGLEVCERYQDDVWEQHINFKMHNQKFCNTLIDCIENIFDTTLVLDCLREFGATYAVDFNGTVKVPTNYWDRLEAAITSKAKELKQLDITKNSVFLLGNKDLMSSETNSTQGIVSVEEREDCQETDFSSTNSSNETNYSSPGKVHPLITISKSSSILTQTNERDKKAINYLISSFKNSPNQLTHSKSSKLLTSDFLSTFDGASVRRRSKNSPLSNKSVCPVKAQAWSCFSMFIAEQIKFGYEMELILQSEMRRLGLKDVFVHSSPFGSATSSPRAKNEFFSIPC